MLMPCIKTRVTNPGLAQGWWVGILYLLLREPVWHVDQRFLIFRRYLHSVSTRRLVPLMSNPPVSAPDPTTVQVQSPDQSVNDTVLKQRIELKATLMSILNASVLQIFRIYKIIERRSLKLRCNRKGRKSKIKSKGCMYIYVKEAK